MASVWDILQRTYSYLFDELPHPFTKDWLLVPSPPLLFIILLSYNIFCIKIGPILMKNRPPYRLKMAINFYNIFQVLLNLYLGYEGCIYLFSGNFNFQCEGPDEAGPLRERVNQATLIYFLTKLTDLLDTVFFVLRKSERQITFLHLYHHNFMPIASWIAIKYVPGGQGVIIGTINSFVHFFMYFYYLIAGLGPQYQKYLWWKKHLTTLQIVQFFIVLIHSVNSLFHSCSYPSFLKLLSIIESITFIYMFSKFYYRSYIKDKRVNGSKQLINKETPNCVSYESNKKSINNENCITMSNKKYFNAKSKGNNQTNGKYDKHE